MAARPLLTAIAIGMAGALAVPALAQSAVATRTLPVSGSAPQVCAIQPPRLQAGGLVNFTGIDGDTLRVAQFADSATLATRPASATVAFSTVCNFPHRLSVSSENNGLWPVDSRVANVPNGFTSAVPYVASVSWNGSTTNLATDAKTRRLIQQVVTVNSPAVGDLDLHLAISAGASNSQVNAPLIAGNYADTLRITLEPQ